MTGCGDNLPGSGLDTPESLDRIRFAALKISGGDLDRLTQAVELAQADWRDLLMAAGFGHDTSAHRAWEIGEVVNRWLAGEQIDGVDFVLNAAVEVTDGEHRGTVGAVVSLASLDPVPSFVVEPGEGKDIVVEQSNLRPTG